MSTHVERLPGSRPHQSFASLRDSGYRAFFVGSATAMLADSIEHVISYWVVFQQFHSPALGGFAVLSHWLPFLIFSVPVGALADRRDPRRLIQLGMLLFMFVSVAWAMVRARNRSSAIVASLSKVPLAQALFSCAWVSSGCV